MFKLGIKGAPSVRKAPHLKLYAFGELVETNTEIVKNTKYTAVYCKKINEKLSSMGYQESNMKKEKSETPFALNAEKK